MANFRKVAGAWLASPLCFVVGVGKLRRFLRLKPEMNTKEVNKRMLTHNPKRVAAKLQTVIDAWTNLRPTKTFAGMTLDQFKAKVQPSLAVRDQLVTVQGQAKDGRQLRHASDSTSLDLAQLVVNLSLIH